MRRVRSLARGALLCAGGAFANGDTQGDPAAGKMQVGQCRICHGIDGHAKIAVAPHMSGEPASYITGQLKAFRAGKRVHEVKSPIAADLSEDGTRAAADRYAAVSRTITPP